MADKKDKKEAEVVGIEIGGLVALVVIIATWPSILAYLQIIANALGLSTFFNQVVAFSSIWGPQAGDWFRGFLNFMIGLSLPVSLFFLIGIIYSVEQLKHIRKKEEEKYDIKVEPAYEANVNGNAVLADRWEQVQAHVSSDNPSDWRQAILEADIMLDDVLTTLGYQGEGIGEKLNRVEKGDMKTLNDAWEAHKVRNQIAHEGAGFPLSKYEAQRVINMYKKVFEEFYYI